MGLAYAITAAFAQWIICWALGVKAIDSFMITVVILVVAVTVKMLTSASRRADRTS
jgi:hypothetical protein